MTVEKLDILVRALRIVCPATGIDGPGVIGMREGAITFVESGSNVGGLRLMLRKRWSSAAV